MVEKEIYEKMNLIFQKVFSDERIQINSGTTVNDVEGWDSLMHIVLISEIENAFKIKFSAKEAFEMKNVGEIVNIIVGK